MSERELKGEPQGGKEEEEEANGKAHTHTARLPFPLSLAISIGHRTLAASFIRRIVMAGMRRWTFDIDNEDGDASR